MITLAEAQAPLAGTSHPRHVAADPAAKLVSALLFLTILSSPLVVIEPAPHEFLVVLLGAACFLAKVPFNRRLLPLLVLLLIWNLGGAIALPGVLDGEKDARYMAISVFMAISAVIFACLFADQDASIRRLQLMRRTYIVAAFIASIIGILGYLNIPSGALALFANAGRAHSTFKDPNVFGPFLILPLLMLAYSLLTHGFRVARIVAFLVIALGLLLCFSRGAWVHAAISTATLLLLMFITAQDMRTRAKLTVLSIVALAAFAGLIAFALSFDVIGDMFKERARLIQPYDAGTNMGRFNLQHLALTEILDNPFGLGPFGFTYRYGLQQHNVYMQAFLVYGWIGGVAYLALVLLTLALGLRAALTRSPWQPFAITALATFVGAAIESLVIDSDHWRHYFLLMGILWGTYVNTVRMRERANPAGLRSMSLRSTSM